MRATWRVMSAISMPQASGSSNARRSDTCSAPSTITARRTSTPPCSIAAGGICSASKTGAGSFMSAMSRRVLDLGGFARPFRRLADCLLEADANALQRLLLAHHLVVRVGARDMTRRVDEQQPPRTRIVEAAAQRHMQFAIVHGDPHHFVG